MSGFGYFQTSASAVSYDRSYPESCRPSDTIGNSVKMRSNLNRFIGRQGIGDIDADSAVTPSDWELEYYKDGE